MNNQDFNTEEFLPMNPEFNEEMTVPMEVVEKNPQRFIIQECIPACQELWRKNIYTFMASNYLDTSECWIEVDEDALSDENREVYDALEGEDIIKFSFHSGCLNFGVRHIGKLGQERLLELDQKFKMQDVQQHLAYITLEEFLIRCGCFDEIPNPDYVPMSDPLDMDLPIDEVASYYFRYNEWCHSIKSQKTIKIFSKDKVIKPIEEYLNGTDFIYEDGRVYLGEYHYQKHLNYIASLENNNSAPKMALGEKI